MKILRIMINILLIPVLAVITLVQWIAIFLNSISSVIMGILSFIIAATGIVSLLCGISSGRDTLNMLVGAFVIFVIPYVENWFVERIALLRCLISKCIRS